MKQDVGFLLIEIIELQIECICGFKRQRMRVLNGLNGLNELESRRMKLMVLVRKYSVLSDWTHRELKGVANVASVAVFWDLTQGPFACGVFLPFVDLY